MSNADSSAAAAVAITGLRKSYGNNEVLKGIDLQVRPGEVIAIIGKSGSGKSTLLRCINGLEIFQHGNLTVQGQPLVYSDHKVVDQRVSKTVKQVKKCHCKQQEVL